MHCQRILDVEHGQVAIRGERRRTDVNRSREAREEGHQLFQSRRGPFADQHCGFRVSIPRFRNVTIGGKQSISHDKSGARDAGSQCWSLLGKSDLVHAEDVANGITISV